MGYKSIEWAFSQKLLPSKKLLLLALAKCRNDETGECFPSYDALCEMTGQTRHTISKFLKELESDGFIRTKKRYGTSQKYELIMSSSVHVDTSVHLDTSAQVDTSVQMDTVSSVSLDTASSVSLDTIKVIKSNLKGIEDSEASATPVKVKRARKSEPPHSFNIELLPEDWKTYCFELCGDKVDPDIEFKKLKRWASKSGKIRTDKGWSQTWDNWIAKALKDANEHPSYKPKAPENPFEQAARRAAIRRIQEAQEEREAQDLFGGVA